MSAFFALGVTTRSRPGPCRLRRRIVVVPTSQAKVPHEDIGESTVIRVQGTVQRFDTHLIEKEDFFFEQEDADAFDLQEFEGSPAIAVSEITVVESPE